jgi:hypothetical protein
MKTRLFSGLSLLLAAAGCRVEAETAPPAVPPPQAQAEVVVQPPTAEVVVETAPAPPPVVVEPPPPPSPGVEFVWAPGYHRWYGGRYIWVRGHYERRPHSGAHWVPAHWAPHARGHVWIEAHWE